MHLSRTQNLHVSDGVNNRVFKVDFAALFQSEFHRYDTLDD